MSATAKAGARTIDEGFIDFPPPEFLGPASGVFWLCEVVFLARRTRKENACGKKKEDREEEEKGWLHAAGFATTRSEVAAMASA